MERTVSQMSSHNTQSRVTLSQSEDSDIDPHIINNYKEVLIKLKLNFLKRDLSLRPRRKEILQILSNTLKNIAEN